jgi:hypothetical protein
VWLLLLAIGLFIDLYRLEKSQLVRLDPRVFYRELTADLVAQAITLASEQLCVHAVPHQFDDKTNIRDSPTMDSSNNRRRTGYKHWASKHFFRFSKNCFRLHLQNPRYTLWWCANIVSRRTPSFRAGTAEQPISTKVVGKCTV